MTPRDFAYWLKGHFELCDPDRCNKLSEKQVQIIREHIDLVFEKKTPTAIKSVQSESFGDPLVLPGFSVITGEHDDGIFPSWLQVDNDDIDYPTTC